MTIALVPWIQSLVDRDNGTKQLIVQPQDIATKQGVWDFRSFFLFFLCPFGHYTTCIHNPWMDPSIVSPVANVFYSARNLLRRYMHFETAAHEPKHYGVIDIYG